MPERQPMTTRLKTLFQRPELFVLAGGINPIGAKMAEALGYDAFYMSGGNTSAHQLGWPDSGTSMRDMVDNARKIVLSVEIPVFADADTGYGDAISTHYTVREYIQAGITGCHIEDQTFPPKSGARRRCISIAEMVGKLRAAMDAKEALDPDFVIMARCDLGGVPGASFAEIIERCQAYKAEAQVDVVCPNGLRTWEEIREAIRLIPGPVVPLIPAHLSPYPSLQAQQDAGAAAAWFPALTTMAGLQANWDFLSDFQQRGTLALDALRAQAAQSPWGIASNGRNSGRVASALHGGDVSSRLTGSDSALCDASLRLSPAAITEYACGPDRRQHPRPQHPPTRDVDRLEHPLYRRQPLHLAAGREAAGRRCAAPDGLPDRKGPGRRHSSALPPSRPIPGGRCRSRHARRR